MKQCFSPQLLAFLECEYISFKCSASKEPKFRSGQGHKPLQVTPGSQNLCVILTVSICFNLSFHVLPLPGFPII